MELTHLVAMAAALGGANGLLPAVAGSRPGP
jgi:hypothetical protein